MRLIELWEDIENEQIIFQRGRLYEIRGSYGRKRNVRQRDGINTICPTVRYRKRNMNTGMKQQSTLRGNA